MEIVLMTMNEVAVTLSVVARPEITRGFFPVLHDAVRRDGADDSATDHGPGQLDMRGQPRPFGFPMRFFRMPP